MRFYLRSLARRYGTESFNPIRGNNVPANNSQEGKTKSFISKLEDKSLHCVVLWKSGEIDALKIDADDGIKGNPQKFLSGLEEKSARKLYAVPYYQKIIKSFDPKSWNEFVVKNLNPVIVNNIGVVSDPNNLFFYNFCISKDDPNSKSAQDFAFKTSNVIKYSSLVRRTLRNNEEKGVDIIYDLKNSSDSKLSKRLKNIFEKVLHDENNKISLNDKVITEGFLRRIADAPSLNKAAKLAEYLGLASLGKDGRFSEKLCGYNLSKIPFPQSFMEYEAMWKVLESVELLNLSPVTRSRLFFNSSHKKNWMANLKVVENLNFEFVDNYIKSIAQDLILPEYISKFEQKGQNSVWGLPHKFEKFEDPFLFYALSEINLFTAEKLLSDLTLQQLAGYANRFDRSIPQIEQNKGILVNQLKNSKEEGGELPAKWHKLFEDCEIDGFKFKVMINESDLQNLGNLMSNCVISFTKRCETGHCHIVSMISESGEQYAIRFNSSNLAGFKPSIAMYEVNSPKNAGVPQQVMMAAESLATKLQNGSIKISQNFGVIKKNLTIDEYLGFSISDESEREKIYQAYRKERLFSKVSELKDLSHFYEEIGLEKFLNLRIREDFKEARSPSYKITKAFLGPILHSYSQKDVTILD